MTRKDGDKDMWSMKEEKRWGQTQERNRGDRSGGEGKKNDTLLENIRMVSNT